MSASAIPIAILTLFWLVVGCVLPFVIPKGPNRGLLQVILMLTAACCWIFWFCCYLAQMNPLIGPKLSNRTLILMAKQWGTGIDDL
ncbi:V-type proton ATPase subunit e-like [Ischnura elegans]|uniref:V-type proton ATPase subunit e-like n=1 Tax=Ischnura elegans TaxID=197161 RepID=UPI001ED891A5|nr:V-type proton ATPase subunit e-like [Ischnura elegans]